MEIASSTDLLNSFTEESRLEEKKLEEHQKEIVAAEASLTEAVEFFRTSTEDKANATRCSKELKSKWNLQSTTVTKVRFIICLLVIFVI